MFLVVVVVLVEVEEVEEVLGGRGRVFGGVSGGGGLGGG